MTTIITAIITGAMALIGTIFSGKTASDKAMAEVEKTQAVTATKIDELTREVREHNNFARRMPVVEEQIKVINHRLDDLENSEKKG